MTSLLKVDLIIHCTADQYHRYSSAYPLFSLLQFSLKYFFTASEKRLKKLNQIITGVFRQKPSLKLIDTPGR